MDANFSRQSYIVDHLASTIKEDVVICLNRTSSKDLLLSYVIKEFTWQTRRPCIVLTSGGNEKSHNTLKEWLALFTCLQLKHLEIFEENQLNKYDAAFIMSIKSFVNNTDNKTFVKDISLLVVDLTDVPVDQESLHRAKKVYAVGKDVNKDFRFVVLFNIHECLRNPLDLKKTLELCTATIPLNLKIGSDALVFGSNGNLIKSTLILPDSKTYHQADLYMIETHLKECESFLTMCHDNELSRKKQFLEIVHSLEFNFEMFGPIAFALSINDCYDTLQDKEEHSSHDVAKDDIFVDFFKTKFLIMEKLIGNFFCREKELSIVTQCFKEALIILETTKHSCLSSGGKFRFAFVVESYKKARILYSTLQELKVTSAYRYLDELSTCIFDEENHDSISKCNSTIILLTANVLSNFKPKLQLNGCVSFKVPNDFEEFLLMKRMLKKTSGILYFVIAPESKMKEEQIKMLHEFERIEEVLLQKMPSYINPEEGVKAELLPKLDPKSTEGVNPEESISIVNRYCKFLSTGKSTFAVNSEFAFIKDERASQMHGRTFIHMPVKSLLTEPIKGPLITLPCNGYDLNDLRIITRMASSMEACRMLQDAMELDGSFMPTRDTRKVKEEYSSRENASLLSRKHWYIKQIPKLLAGSFPNPGEDVYIYVVEDDVTIEAGNILDKKHLGFCTTKRLPNIPSFAIFRHKKKLVLNIKETPGIKTLEKSFARPLYEFHFYIIDYLGYETSISNENSVKNGLLWTPLRYEENEYAIDVSYLKATSFSRAIFMKEGRLNFNFNAANFTDTVVIPRHREKENALLIVENIRKDVKMSDPFPNESVASSYTDYFQRKYNIELRPDQCMVEVRFKNNDLNLLQRKYPENSEHKTKATHTLIMIPEDLCCAHPIPLHLWNKIDTIPATIHRLASLLLVKELQDILYNEFFLNEVGPCPAVDEGLDLELNKIHVEQDMSGLQFIEELCNNSSEIACDKGSLITIDKESEILNEDAFKDVEGHAKPNLKEGAFLKRNLDSLFSNKVNFDAAIGFKELQPVPTQSNANNDKDREKHRQPCKILPRSVPPLSFLLVAMTTVEANDLYNYERLELVGDAFLSFTISTELFYCNINEHVMSIQKSKMVSNMTLYEKGNSKKLWKYLVEDRFDYKRNPLISCVFERATPCNVENNILSLGKKLSLPECINKLDRFTSIGSGNHVHDTFQSKETSTRDFILDGNCDTMLSTDRQTVHGTERCLTTAEQNSSLTDQCTLPSNYKLLNSPLPPNLQDSETFGRFKTAIRNKAIADSVEALIGLFFIFSGESVALSILQWLGYDLKNMINAREKSRCNMKLKLTKNSSPYQKDSNSRLKQEADLSNAFGGQDSPPIDARHSENTPTEYEIAKPDLKNELNETCSEAFSYEDGPPITWLTISAPNYRLAELHDFERKINYQFNNIDILAEALLHPSYFRELSFQLHCNQRLEFLGDSVLYLLLTDYLCRKFPMATNADITFVRGIVVSTRTFATISLLNDFQRYVQAFSPEMSYTVKEWARKIEQEKANGILWPKLTMADVRSYDPFFNKDKRESSSVPKDLADVFESVAGAIYIDSGRIQAVWSSYYVLLKDVLDSLPSPQT